MSIIQTNVIEPILFIPDIVFFGHMKYSISHSFIQYTEEQNRASFYAFWETSTTPSIKEVYCSYFHGLGSLPLQPEAVWLHRLAGLAGVEVAGGQDQAHVHSLLFLTKCFIRKCSEWSFFSLLYIVNIIVVVE